MQVPSVPAGQPPAPGLPHQLLHPAGAARHGPARGYCAVPDPDGVSLPRPRGIQAERPTALEVPLDPTHSEVLPTTKKLLAALHQGLVCAEPRLRAPWAPRHPGEVQPERPSSFPCFGLATLPRRLGSDPGSQSLRPWVGPSQRPPLLRRHRFSAPHTEASGLWPQLEPPWELRVMPSASEARAGEAGPCQGQRRQHHHRPGHPFWEMPAGRVGGLAVDRVAAVERAAPSSQRALADHPSPPLASSTPGRATGRSPGGWSPSPPCRCAQMPLQRQRGPAPASQAAPTQRLHSAAHAARQAPFFSTLFRAPPFSLLPQDEQSGPQELPRAHLQRAGGRRADESAAWWVVGPGFLPELSRPGCQPRWPSPSSTWSFACEETGPPRGRGALLPRAGTWRPGSRRLLRAGPPPDAPTLASVSKVLKLLCWAFLILSC